MPTATKLPKVTAADASEGMVYVTIPEKNVLDHAHPSIGLNREEFKAGETYLVTQKVADYINDRLKNYDMATRRILRPMVSEAESGTDKATQ